ncbi:MAG: hypothetical protein MI921_23345 [Cytophagales bacterium]|nr:hypothetical protein [Cytophagales bacterium]
MRQPVLFNILTHLLDSPGRLDYILVNENRVPETVGHPVQVKSCFSGNTLRYHQWSFAGSGGFQEIGWINDRI